MHSIDKKLEQLCYLGPTRLPTYKPDGNISNPGTKSEPLMNNKTFNLVRMKSKEAEMSVETIGQRTRFKNWPFSNVIEVISLLCSFVILHCIQYVLEE
jgi:hypothetical protein